MHAQYLPAGVAETDAHAVAPTKPRPALREDLNGLRGVAIALVVVFHVWMGRVSGGVDVFLTLTGFFFTASLIRAAASGGSLNPFTRLGRVLRRLGPPLVIVLLGVAISIDPVWALLACIGLPLMVMPAALAQRFVRARSREARDLGATLSTRLDEVFHGIVQIKLNALEK